MIGHPKRNWDAEDFICRQCRLITPKSSSPSHPPSFLSLGVNSKGGQASSTQAFYGPPSNHPRSYANGGYYPNSPSIARYPHDHPDIQTTVSSPSSHSHTSQTRPTGVTFAHYQPQQGGFSTSRPTYAVQGGNSPQHGRYTITPPHTVSATGIAPYPPTFHVSLPSTFYEHTSYVSPTSDTGYNPLTRSFPRTMVPSKFSVVPSLHQFVPNKWWTTSSCAGGSTILQWTWPRIVLPHAGNNKSDRAGAVCWVPTCPIIPT